MPNWCNVDFLVKFEDLESAKIALTLIRLHFAYTPEGKGTYIGMSNKKCLFFGNLPDPNDQYLYISGSVKWCTDWGDAWGLVDFFLKRGALPDITIAYEEAGSRLFGKYVYIDGAMIDYAVPDKHWFWKKHRDGEEVGIDDIPVKEFVTTEIPRQ
jgi:hypothetical protein